MPKTKAYVARQSKSGDFTCHINKTLNKYLDVYCELNKINKTRYVNDVLMERLEKEFQKMVEV